MLKSGNYLDLHNKHHLNDQRLTLSPTVCVSLKEWQTLLQWLPCQQKVTMELVGDAVPFLCECG